MIRSKYIALYLISTVSLFGEPLSPAPKSFSDFQRITGFHSHFDKQSGYEFRILEVDGSATVAFNPIYLYLVVTNNASGNELQSTILTLPQASEIKSIRFLDQNQTIEVDVLLDRTNDEGSKSWTVKRTIIVSIPIKNGKLPEQIQAIIQNKKMQDKSPRTKR